jgi:Na+/H+ antiporter NhaD/arsenite permease-like protein
MPYPNLQTPGLALPLWSALPFAGFLLSLAIVPLLRPDFWSKRYGTVAAAFGLPVAGWFLLNAPEELLRAVTDYVSFLVLVGSLFAISGGILVRGTVRATPAVNTGMLLAGGVIAALLGTTAASMLLVRPLLRANAHRKRAAHVIVFLIIVAGNAGGLLVPTGPPLFLGYLKGVPFFWTLRALWPIWLFTMTVLLGAFFAIDRRLAAADGEAGAPPAVSSPVRFEGGVNLLLMAAAVGAIFLPFPWRESVMAAAAFLSIRITPRALRRENRFTWHPVREVAILFAAIFATMIPALQILSSRGGELGFSGPRAFFWASGIFSSVLDNAPAYLSFLSLARGIGTTGPAVAGVSVPVLKAISAGSVLMGACTYIGNAPNFMIKSIADEAGVRMPSFLGYMGWSCAVLVPTFLLVTFVFF